MEFLHFSPLLILLLFLYMLVSFFLRKLKKYPPSPPFSLPLIGHLYLLKKPLHRSLAKLSNKYGPVLLVRFGSRPVLVVSSPSAAEECLTKNDIVFANRPKLLAGKHLGYNYTTLPWASYGDLFRSLKRVASLEILSNHRVQLFADARRDEIYLLVKRLARDRASEDDEYRVVEMKSKFFEMMSNVMMRMIAGRRYYDNDNDGNLSETLASETRKFKEIVTQTFRTSSATNISDFVPILRWIGFDGYEHTLKVLQEKRDSFMQDLIDEHRKMKGCDEGLREKTLTDVLLSLQETDPDGWYNDEIIKGMMQVLLTAGTDTSITAMEWAMTLLLNNPETLIKAQNEIDDKIGHSRLVDDSDLPHLPYLHAVIVETLRMYPPGPVLIPRESSVDCILEGHLVPGGTMTLVNLWAIQNDPKLWDEPSKFKPERFVNLEGQREGFVLIPFSYGRRGCPAENFAMRVVGLTVASLIQCFDWSRVGREMVDMSEGTGLNIPKAQPLVAKCRPRLAMGKLISQL